MGTSFEFRVKLRFLCSFPLFLRSGWGTSWFSTSFIIFFFYLNYFLFKFCEYLNMAFKKPKIFKNIEAYFSSGNWSITKTESSNSVISSKVPKIRIKFVIGYVDCIKPNDQYDLFGIDRKKKKSQVSNTLCRNQQGSIRTAKLIELIYRVPIKSSRSPFFGHFNVKSYKLYRQWYQLDYLFSFSFFWSNILKFESSLLNLQKLVKTFQLVINTSHKIELEWIKVCDP